MTDKLDKEAIIQQALFRVEGRLGDLAPNDVALMTLDELVAAIRNTILLPLENDDRPHNFSFEVEYLPFLGDIRESEEG